MDRLPTPDLRALTLTLTEQCNLRCNYCYVPVDRGLAMSNEIADQAVDLFLQQAAQQPNLTLSFFGGEPLLSIEGMRRVNDRVRSRARPDQRVRCVTPTNGLLLEGERLEFCREQVIELAISVDGAEGTAERCDRRGADSTADLIKLLPGIFSLDPAARIIARMTVTPSNVSRLASNVRDLSRLGFRRIAIQAAFEEAWSDEAIEAWGREHRRIGTWLIGAAGAGASVPDLPAWRAIEKRLLLGKPRTGCGAGSRVVAVSTDGNIYPCYRFVFEQPEACRLGHVSSGFTNRGALDRFAAITPQNARPEHGDCASCPSHDGCIHFCPALGFLALGDPGRVPELACKLMRAQVEAIRPYAAVRTRQVRRPSPSRWAAAAFLAATVSTAGSAVSCGGDVSTNTGNTGSDAGGGGYSGGVCPVQVDAQDEYTAGVCAVKTDTGTDEDAQPDVYMGGICDINDASQEYTGGQCPVQVDASDEYTGGMC